MLPNKDFQTRADTFSLVSGKNQDGVSVIWVKTKETDSGLYLNLYCISEWWIEYWMNLSSSEHPHMLRFTLAEYCRRFTDYSVPPEELRLQGSHSEGGAFVFELFTPHKEKKA